MASCISKDKISKVISKDNELGYNPAQLQVNSYHVSGYITQKYPSQSMVKL